VWFMGGHPTHGGGGHPAEAARSTLSADQNLGALIEPSASPSVAPRTPLAPGSTVAFFGDSQAMTLLLNKPADLSNYINAIDATIAGCGILLGKVQSRSGERHNLAANCPNWRSAWESRVNQYEPPSPSSCWAPGTCST
jgi:hypothetical protein